MLAAPWSRFRSYPEFSPTFPWLLWNSLTFPGEWSPGQFPFECTQTINTPGYVFCLNMASEQKLQRNFTNSKGRRNNCTQTCEWIYAEDIPIHTVCANTMHMEHIILTKSELTFTVQCQHSSKSWDNSKKLQLIQFLQQIVSGKLASGVQTYNDGYEVLLDCRHG